ncbi:MAG: UDP-N-acetylglucosamine--LPS N-acetylglucosamine transferase [Actinomycetia bacterium]|nr:UDP-N-acetylglucosamine--LPS N-acetylglucosamine transferase [Actinomycetes bacterium]MCP4959411.1 UDP-N-acetylglucosamine--LPS N-acetylglucosamine transferase [Actinomycetes bacterium]
MKMLLVSSNGGHLHQLLALRSWWEQHDRVWATAEKPDAESLLEGERVVWSNHPTTRNAPNMVRNFFLANRVISNFKPDVVVSTGAGVAPPFFLAAKMRRISTVYLEVYDRLDSRTMAGSMCYPMSDRFLLQWEEQRSLYPRGIVVGRVL